MNWFREHHIACNVVDTYWAKALDFAQIASLTLNHRFQGRQVIFLLKESNVLSDMLDIRLLVRLRLY